MIRITSTIAAAVLLAGLVLPTQAAECNNSISQYGSGRLEVPPEKYWRKPGKDYVVLDCATISLLYPKGENADCHIRGGYIERHQREIDAAYLSLLGLKPGDVFACDHQSGALLSEVLVHEYAHRAGWQHGTGKWMTVPQWAKASRGRF